MLDESSVPDVAHNEQLVRFIMTRRHVRADGTVKPDAFVPHPHVSLSVNRTLKATDAETWKVGREISEQRKKDLIGYAKVLASTVVAEDLSVDKAPIPQGDETHPNGNPNHANIDGWPSEKSRQKLIALEVANAASFERPPV